MNERDPHKVFVGMRVEHKYRKRSVNPEYDWYCTINKVDEDNNKLEVSVTSTHGQSHPETWNLAHTVNGLADREYLEITEETK